MACRCSHPAAFIVDFDLDHRLDAINDSWNLIFFFFLRVPAA